MNEMYSFVVSIILFPTVCRSRNVYVYLLRNANYKDNFQKKTTFVLGKVYEMSDPPPEADDGPVHESLSRIIKICKDSLETISTLDSITGCDLVRKIKDEGNKKIPICIFFIFN